MYQNRGINDAHNTERRSYKQEKEKDMLLRKRI